jgi:hypothetical protein
MSQSFRLHQGICAQASTNATYERTYCTTGSKDWEGSVLLRRWRDSGPFAPQMEWTLVGGLIVPLDETFEVDERQRWRNKTVTRRFSSSFSCSLQLTAALMAESRRRKGRRHAILNTFSFACFSLLVAIAESFERILNPLVELTKQIKHN